MKKIILVTLLLISTAMTLTIVGCKKGNKDPFITFKSREARLTGKWKITAWTVNEKDQLTGHKVDTTAAGGCTFTRTRDTSYEDFITFDKSGEYEVRYKMTATLTMDPQAPSATCVASTSSVDAISMSEGIWMFAGGSGNFKNKEELILTDVYHVNGAIWDIIQLKSKEILIEFDETDPVTSFVTKTAMTLTAEKE